MNRHCCSIPALRLTLTVAAVFLTGCTVNATRPLPTGALPSEGRAVVVYGVGVEGAWDYQAFAIELDEYSMESGNITGNCYRFTRTQATVPATPGKVSYFAFDVPPGHYVYSPFNGAQLSGEVVAFVVPADRSVYIGDFIYGKDRVVTLRRSLDAAQGPMHAALPGLAPDIALAQAVPASRPRLFLCTP